MKLQLAVASLLTGVLLLAGCGQQYYRYPCQNPDNWEKVECKKPICEANRDCPEYIFKTPKKPEQSAPTQPLPKGDCK